MIHFLTAGESHGPAEVAILEGVPAGLSITKEDIQRELDKRRGGLGRGGRGTIEKDQVKILSGVRFGKTLGSPIALLVENLDYTNWAEKMSLTSPKSRGVASYHLGGGIDSHLGKINNPRPGHADLAAAQKYGFDDIRNVLERASARETIMRVAVGAVCKKFLSEFGIEIASHTIQIGQIRLMRPIQNFDEIKNVFKTDPDIHCTDKKISQQMKNAILDTTKKKDTLGGVIEIIGHHVPVGLGSHVHFDRKLDGRLAGALMSIPSVKAVEIGEGVEISGKFGSEVHDSIYFNSSQKSNTRSDLVVGYYRKTNRAGGIEGGISNGEDIICRVYHKPISTLGNPLPSVNIKTKETAPALIERSDICVVPRAGVISESMVAFVLANALVEKFGGDSMEEIKSNFEYFLKSLK